MIDIRYRFNMPKIEEGTEFCAIFEDKDGKTAEEWFMCDDEQEFGRCIQGVALGRVLLGLFRSVNFEIRG